MTTSRVLSGLLVVLVAAGLGVACKGKQHEEQQTLQRDEFVRQLTAIKQAQLAVQQARRDQDAVRSELAPLEALPAARLSPEQQAHLGELKAKLDALDTSAGTQYDELQTKLADFLTVALNDFPSEAETAEGLRVYADEAMVYADDAVAKAGDYKKALDQVGLAQGYFEQVNLPAYQPLTAKIATLEEMRYITQERFDQIAKNMTQDQVKGIAGTPYYRNVKEDPGKKVVTWLFPKRDGGAAAVYFKTDTGKVYGKSFDAVKTTVVKE